MSTPIGHWTPTELSTVEFEVCWERLGLGDLPYVLDLPSPGRTREERRDLVAGVLDQLRARDLADDRGLHPDLRDQFDLLAHSSWAVDTRLISDRVVRARGAASGHRGVVAVIDGARVVLRSMPDHTVVTEMVGLAGDAPVSRARSVSVRAAALDAAVRDGAGGADSTDGGDPKSLAGRLVEEGERPDDAHRLAHMLDGVVHRGQFSVVASDGTGQKRPGPWVVGFHDNAEGRFLQLRRNGWVTVTPLSTQQLVGHVRELLASTRDVL
ncbi:ESX secretion-associated protein EspG [Streptoalloteichus hindustanus]|uniref:EspG family protein n=1 Tax=Streptoalloteichus hindustanus TaxID=2017 RepID=A0A1M5NPU5_STRHI|nr:ESX secretion-associated protein EspG [Streptoalloteichus hindustanus]SHG91540.1 EspG family protein [Streptoalloteichus hindustanus]